MTATESVEILGAQFTVEAPDAESAAAVRHVLSGFRAPAGPDPTPRFLLQRRPDGGWQLVFNGDVVGTDPSLATILGMLEWRLVTQALEGATGLFHLHGAALCAPTVPAGMILAGGSARGKTTLTLALMLRGFVPFSDDVALLDPDSLELRHLPRAFHVSDHTWALLEELNGSLPRRDEKMREYFSPPQWAERPVPARWLLFPEYRPNQQPALVPYSPTDAARAIVAQSLTLSRDPRMTLAVTARLTAATKCYRCLCGDLPNTIAMVQRLVAKTLSV